MICFWLFCSVVIFFFFSANATQLHASNYYYKVTVLTPNKPLKLERDDPVGARRYE